MLHRTSLVAQTVKCLPTMRDTQVWSLGREDPLEREMAAYSVLLPGKSHGQRSLVGCSPWGRKESDTTEWLHFPILCYVLREGEEKTVFVIHNNLFEANTLYIHNEIRKKCLWQQARFCHWRCDYSWYFNNLFPLSILYSLCLQQVPQLVLVLCLMEWPRQTFISEESGPWVVLPGLDCLDLHWL